MRLLEGLDDIGLTLKHTDEIVAWEKRMANAQPWLQEARDSRATVTNVHRPLAGLVARRIPIDAWQRRSPTQARFAAGPTLRA